MNSLMLLQFHELSTTQTDSADTKRDDKKKKKKNLNSREFWYKTNRNF